MRESREDATELSVKSFEADGDGIIGQRGGSEEEQRAMKPGTRHHTKDSHAPLMALPLDGPCLCPKVWARAPLPEILGTLFPTRDSRGFHVAVNPSM